VSEYKTSIAHACPKCDTTVFIISETQTFENKEGNQITTCPGCGMTLNIPQSLLDSLNYSVDEDE